METLKYLLIYIKNLLYNFVLLIIEVFYFSKYLWWWRLRFYLAWFYFFYRPYQIIKTEIHLTKLSFESLIYGETPLVTLRKILQNIKVTSGDVFFDLGSGRGSVVFFVNLYYKIKSIGLDVVPTFIRNSIKIKEKLKLSNVSFKLTNILEEDFSAGSIFYLTPTTWEEDIVKRIVQKLGDIKTGSFIISVSVQLKAPYLKQIKYEISYFSWGKSRVYYYKKI